ncbi:MAG: DUF6438 domain-containing protein [Kordia sp.]|uniref:DUF6438 domain-containing protein n=1 Tax=Kordia sp. TaxID=1965332 RepID=UPI00385F337F
MKSIFYLLLIVLVPFSSTTQNKIPTVQDKIQGAWIDAKFAETDQEKDSLAITIIDFNLSGSNNVFALRFKENKVEFFNQFSKATYDTLAKKWNYNTFVGFVPYQLKADSLFIQHPLQNDLVFQYTIDASKKDTLLLRKNNTIRYTLVPLKKKEKDSLSFDQIVLSRSGCYGTCPIMNISIHKDGSVLFDGEKYTDVIGLHKAKLSPAFTTYIFQKLENIQLTKVGTFYNVDYTDDETITTTFLHNRKIVKSIHDYGRAGTKELIWAYKILVNLYAQIPLTKVQFDKEKPKMDYIRSNENTKRLFLQKSEAFILWLALQNATSTTKSFEETYLIKHPFYKTNIKKVTSNGQLFTYHFKDGSTKTYDIGYNFITRNFTEADFKELK